MPAPEILDFAKLLAPIPGDKPTGIDFRADPSPASPYYVIKDARSAARAAERQLLGADEEATGPPPDWKPIVQHGTKALAEKTKDLEITAYLIEALVRQHGFVGLRDGLRLARELVEKFWDGLYPLPDEEGVATRVAPLTGLNGDDAEGTLITPITRIPITDGPSAGKLTTGNYNEAQALNKIADPKVKEKKIAEGALSPEAFQKAVAETPAKFFKDLVEGLTQCSEEYARLCAVLDEKCGSNAPPSSNIRSALSACLDVIKEVARDKLQAAAPAQDASTPDKDGAAGAAAAGPGGVMGVIRDREDAFTHLIKVADFFRRTEPQSPVPFAIEQVVRWGRMPLPDLLNELIPEEGPRKNLFKFIGIHPPEPPPKDARK
jgi:type VI secretion system protein ImpA